MSRKIEIVKAERGRVPLFIGLWGASGSGKTMSALRLATGIQRVNPGPIVFIDTENGRGRHYADRFSYEYVRFDPPFNPLDYLDVLEQVESYKPSVIVLDSFSHEHSGEKGYLETQTEKAQEFANKWRTTPEKAAMPAWAFVSAQRKKLLRHIVRMDSNLIACFRAKEKNSPTVKNGKSVIENMGYMPEAGKEYVFEMTLSALLPPGSEGRVEFQTGNKGEDLMTKLPIQFRDTFKKSGVQLTEEIGQELAKWSSGNSAANPQVAPATQEQPNAKAPTLLEQFESILRDPRVKEFPSMEMNGVMVTAEDYLRSVVNENGGGDDVLRWAINEVTKRLK